MLRLNEFCRLRFKDSPQVDLLLDGRTVQLPNVELMSALVSLSEPTSEADAVTVLAKETGSPAEAAERLLRELVDHGVLVDAERERAELAQVEHWISRGWFEALVFHLLSRDQLYADVVSLDPSASDEIMRDRLRDVPPPMFSRRRADWPTVDAPAACSLPEEPLESVLLRRRSNQPWVRTELDGAEVMALLEHGNIQNRACREAARFAFRERPSAVLESPFADVESYLLAHAVDDIEAGMYHYDPLDGTLGRVRTGDHRELAQRLCIGQDRVATASVALLMTVTWDDAMVRYAGDPRAYRTILVALGELGQRYLIAATALGLSTFITPALAPEVGEELLDRPHLEEAAMYVVACG